MFKAKAISAIIVTGIFGLAACGGGSSDKNDSTVTTVRQKNAALSFTTLPATTLAKTVTTPMPNIGGGATTVAPAITTATIVASGPTTTVVWRFTTTSISRTVTTPLPKLPGR